MLLYMSKRPRPRRPLDLRRFQPLEPHARACVDDLVRRGAVVLNVSAQRVLLKRGSQLATVDAVGRVSWAA